MMRIPGLGMVSGPSWRQLQNAPGHRAEPSPAVARVKAEGETQEFPSAPRKQVPIGYS